MAEKITLKKADNISMEQYYIDNDECTIAVTKADNKLFVSTKSNDQKLANLPHWKALVNCGSFGLKRFEVSLSMKAFRLQIQLVYADATITWLK
jgi:hypothetical protein